MKKIFKLVAASIFLVLICLSQPVKAQLSEAERQERCQNNKNSIVDLETQLRVIDADFSASMTIKEMEDARTQMVFVRGIKNTVNLYIQRIYTEGDIFGVSVENWDILFSIASRYNMLDCLSVNDNDNDLDIEKKRLDCVTDIEKTIAKKIDKAESLDRLALLAKKSEIEKLLASHRTNLTALDCDNMTEKPDKGREEEKDPLSVTLRLTAVLPPGDPYAGTYSIDIEMIQSDGNIKGSGTWSNGATSNFTGTISGGSVTLHRVDISGFSATFWGRVFPDGRMEGTGKNDPASPGGNNSSYTWSAIRK